MKRLGDRRERIGEEIWRTREKTKVISAKRERERERGGNGGSCVPAVISIPISILFPLTWQWRSIIDCNIERHVHLITAPPASIDIHDDHAADPPPPPSTAVPPPFSCPYVCPSSASSRHRVS